MLRFYKENTCWDILKEKKRDGKTLEDQGAQDKYLEK